MSLEQYKDANRKELWEILQIQVDRIAELEKRLSHSQTMGKRQQSIRDLEQQAKGLIDYAEALYMNIKRGKYHQIMMAAGRLQIEAKALKEREL
jgi:hypothetical protein